MEGSVLVVGGGITGIQASLDLTELGFKVYCNHYIYWLLGK